MEELGNHTLPIKEYNNIRVVTFKDIDMVHERPDGTARKRFNDNKKYFIEGEDYFVVKPSEINNRGTTLITETGYLMLVKSFTDNLAWKAQRELVNTYFRVKDVVTMMGAMARTIPSKMDDMESQNSNQNYSSNFCQLIIETNVSVRDLLYNYNVR